MQPISEDDFETAQADAVAAVIAAGGRAAAKGWVPATSGNFSVRIDAETIAITRSGVDKGRLEASDILIQPLASPLLPGSSAEALLHIDHYRAHPAAGAIFHTHSPYATVIGRAHLSQQAVWLAGWELQKALSGVKTHETAVEVPIFANDQDIAALSTRVTARFATALPPSIRACRRSAHPAICSPDTASTPSARTRSRPGAISKPSKRCSIRNSC